jgi:hypothetical protein
VGSFTQPLIPPVYAAVALDNSLLSQSGGNPRSISYTHGANVMMLIAVGYDGCSYNKMLPPYGPMTITVGTSYQVPTLLTSIVASNNYAYLYYIARGAAGTETVYVPFISGCNNWTVIIASFSGVVLSGGTSTFEATNTGGPGGMATVSVAAGTAGRRVIQFALFGASGLSTSNRRYINANQYAIRQGSGDGSRTGDMSYADTSSSITMGTYDTGCSTCWSPVSIGTGLLPSGSPTMPPVYNNIVTETSVLSQSGGNPRYIYLSHSANALLLVGTGYDGCGGGGGPMSLTVDGTTPTRATQLVYSNNYAYLYYITRPTAGTSTIYVSYPGGCNNWSVIAASFTGTTGALEDVTTSDSIPYGSNGAAQVTVSSGTAGHRVVQFVIFGASGLATSNRYYGNFGQRMIQQGSGDGSRTADMSFDDTNAVAYMNTGDTGCSSCWSPVSLGVALVASPTTSTITVTSSPTGSGFVTVDGSGITTPQIYTWAVGSSHTIAAVSPVSCGAGCQYEWNSWSDSGAQSHSIVVPSSATTYTANFKKEWSITFSYAIGGSPQGSPTGPTLSYTRDGAAKSPSLSGTPTAYWVDDGTTWSVTPNPLTGSTPAERWYTNQATSAAASASTTVTLTYYHQYLQTVSYSVTGGGTDYSAPAITANRFGASALQTLTTTATGYWYDAGSSWSVTNPLSGSTSTERWYASSTVSGIISSAQTSAFTYQHQIYLTMQAGTGGTVSPTSGWQNAGASVTISATPNSGYAFSSWTCTGTGCYSGTSSSTSITLNAAITETANFLAQVTMTVSYSVLGGGSGYSAPTFNYVQGGQSKTYTLTTSATQISVDSGTSWSVSPNPLTGSGSSERWYLGGTLSGTASATTWIFSFYHEYLQTVSYSVAGGGSGYSAPSYTANRFGLSAPQTLTTTATGYWYDSGSSWSVTNPLSGSTGSEQWATSQSTSGTVTSAQTTVFTYQNQYYLTMQASPSIAGTVSPTSGWQNAGAPVSITATANSGYGFASWTGSGSGSYSSTNNPATVTMNAPITETANFVSQLSMTVSFSIIGGGTSYSAPVFNYIQGGLSKTYTLTITGTAITVDTGSSWSVTANPLTGSTSSERWYTNGATSGTASSSATIVFTFYHQYLQTLAYSVWGDGTGYSAPTFTANLFGAAAPQILTTTATGYWYDAGSSWTVASNPLSGSSSSEQWVSSQSMSGVADTSQIIVFTYQHQFYLTMQAGTGGTATPTSSWQNAEIQIQIDATPAPNYMFTSWTGSGTGSYSGTSNPATITMNGPISEVASFQLANVDITITSTPTTGAGFITVDGSPVSTPQTFSWIIGSSHNITANSPVDGGLGTRYVWISWSDGGAQSHSYLVPNTPDTLLVSFKIQFFLTVSASPVNGGSTTPDVGTYWYDANSTVPISATPASGFEFISWDATGPGYSGSLTSASITITWPIAETANFQRIPAVTLTVNYQITGDGTGFSAPTLSYVEGGVNKAYTLTQTPAAVAVDKGSTWSVAPSILAGSTNSERWYSNQALSGVATSNATIVFVFRHQYSLTLSYSVSGGGSGYSPPTFTGTLNGGSTSGTLAATPSAYWFDAGSSWSVAPNPLAGSTSSERWLSSQLSNGTVGSANTLVFNYQHQYLLSMFVSPLGAGTTTPQEGSSWQDAGASIAIQAFPTRGAFTSWKGSGSGSYTGSNNPASITINGVINETANIADMANVTITVSSPGPSGSGLVTVDGTQASTPYSATWLIGEQHTVSAQSPVSCGSGCQYVWQSWSDGGAQSHQITVQSAKITLVVAFVKEYSLSISSSTGGSSNPGSGLYWYVDGDAASVSATPSQGYLFTGWLLDGKEGGSSSPILIMMNGPHSVSAKFFSMNTPLCAYVNTDPPGLIPSPVVTPSGCPISPGTQVTVTAQPISNWKFVEFTVTNTTISRNGMTVTFTMPPVSVSVIAHYKYVGSDAPPGGLSVPAEDIPLTALFSVIALAVLLSHVRRRRVVR